MMDVFHHLPKPYDFLAEASRVLTPGGRVVMIEPWTSPLGLLVFGLFCHEGIDRRVDPANPFGDGKQAMDGNAALPRLVFGAHQSSNNLPTILTVKLVEPRPAFTYLLTGGFQPVCLLPQLLLPLMRFADRITAPLSSLTALRALIVLEKSAGS